MCTNFLTNTIVATYNGEILATSTNKLRKKEKFMSCTTRCVPKMLGTFRATTSVSGNNLIISLSNVCSCTIIQGDKIRFFIPSCIDYPQTKINNVKVEINHTEFTAIKFGNVKWDTIKSRTCYCGVIGTESPTITILNELPCSKFDYPVYDTTCTTTESTEED